MTVSKTTSGYWLATGNGPLRPIVAEGHTRRDASKGYARMWTQQLLEKNR